MKKANTHIAQQDSIDNLNEHKLRRLEEEVQVLLAQNRDLQREKTEAEIFSIRKSEFLANMSHELRTPMHAILSFSSMSLKKLGVIEKTRLMNNLSIIYENGQRLLHTLNDILDISKLEAGKMDFNVQLNNLQTEVMAVIREMQSLLLDKGIAYSIDVVGTDGMAEFDSYRIGQVIQNILSNAVKFTPTEGKICVCLSPAELEGAEAIKLSITDEGIGIPEDELNTIFDKYVQSSRKNNYVGGTGLGLSISKKIIAQHRGIIWAENNDNGGSTFHFIIPIKHEENYASTGE